MELMSFQRVIVHTCALLMHCYILTNGVLFCNCSIPEWKLLVKAQTPVGQFV